MVRAGQEFWALYLRTNFTGEVFLTHTLYFPTNKLLKFGRWFWTIPHTSPPLKHQNLTGCAWTTTTKAWRVSRRRPPSGPNGLRWWRSTPSRCRPRSPTKWPAWWAGLNRFTDLSATTQPPLPLFVFAHFGSLAHVPTPPNSCSRFYAVFVLRCIA